MRIPVIQWSFGLTILGLGTCAAAVRAGAPRPIPPEQFAEYEKLGMEMGFLFVASGPFIRSSYNAIEFSKRILSDRLAAIA